MGMIQVYVYIYNSRMQSGGFSFIFGGLGVEVCSLDVALRWQPSASATVRNGEDMVVPVANLRKLWFLKVLQDVTCSFVAGVALGDIPTCEIACRKSLCVTGAILLNDFRKITVQWHWCGLVRRMWHLATFPRVDDMCRKSFFLTGEMLLNDCRKITVIFCGKRSTSEISISCGRHRALYVWCCVYLQIVLELLMYPHQMAKGQRTHSIQWLQ